MKINIVYTSESAREMYGDAGPAYGTARSAAIDLRAAVTEPFTVGINQTVLVPSGLKVQLDPSEVVRPGYKIAAFLIPRSGLGHKQGLILGNSVGLIDEDYQGEVCVSLWRRRVEPAIAFGDFDFSGTYREPIKPGDRIAQMYFAEVLDCEFSVVDAFAATTDRGAGGFGSTGRS